MTVIGKKVNPDDFIISRKRKRYRFAIFANSDICYEYSEWQPRAVDSIEIGAGTGMFSVELATKYPNKQYVAIDVKADRLQKGASEAADRGLTNVRFIRARADQLKGLFAPHSVQSIWVTFPDPFCKVGSANRRLTHPSYLGIYKTLLTDVGKLFFKHDLLSFFTWSLEQIVSEKWTIDELSFDLHGSSLREDYKTITTFEQRWRDKGATINFLSATPTYSAP